MKILVTGGAGYIGSHTVVELASSGHSPVIIDNFNNSKESVVKNIEKIIGKKVPYYEQNFQDINLLQKVLIEEKIEGVIHFAADKAVSESLKEPLKYYLNNVAGFIEFLDQLEKYSDLPVVFSSSCTIYGEPDKLPITEDSEIKLASSPYGSTKQMCETILKDVVTLKKKLRAISLRYFNPIGAHPSGLIGELPLGQPNNLVPFLLQATAGLREELTVYGNDYPTPDGTCIRDYIHVIDLAKAHINALEHMANKKPGYYNYCNVGTGIGSSVLDVINTFERGTGKKVPYKIGLRRQGDIIRIYAEVEKSKTLLDWKANLTLSDALKDAWNWQQTISSKQ
ncbi:MAG: UDP-glucose 4-epimerase GalE [bacterium]|nr:UDP-glucose 4-epimerase GalE [bacterium]